MNAAFLLLTSAWMAGGDPGCCGPSCCAPSCGCCDCGCCCRPTLRERFDAFRNACGSCCGCCGCGCCDCGCCCRPTLRDRINAFLNACGAPRCCGCCCDPCCGGPAPHGHPAVPGKGPEQIGPPKEAKEMPKGAASVAPQLEVTPVAKPGTVIIEGATQNPF